MRRTQPSTGNNTDGGSSRSRPFHRSPFVTGENKCAWGGKPPLFSYHIMPKYYFFQTVPNGTSNYLCPLAGQRDYRGKPIPVTKRVSGKLSVRNAHPVGSIFASTFYNPDPAADFDVGELLYVDQSDCPQGLSPSQTAARSAYARYLRDRDPLFVDYPSQGVLNRLKAAEKEFFSRMKSLVGVLLVQGASSVRFSDDVKESFARLGKVAPDAVSHVEGRTFWDDFVTHENGSEIAFADVPHDRQWEIASMCAYARRLIDSNEWTIRSGTLQFKYKHP